MVAVPLVMTLAVVVLTVVSMRRSTYDWNVYRVEVAHTDDFWTVATLAELDPVSDESALLSFKCDKGEPEVTLSWDIPLSSGEVQLQTGQAEPIAQLWELSPDRRELAFPDEVEELAALLEPQGNWKVTLVEPDGRRRTAEFRTKGVTRVVTTAVKSCEGDGRANNIGDG